ncbi:POU domain, class 6, transcription factor 1 [Onychostruthus taczanowskii]|uniref:POU domain, class 6, transcription factor 1 n=1 Tax=Onychostruthus taczanowskii TaxID=356909 RepID=UPI001B7FFE51|nr:POU domain, class 6, transcription factor 1 [Onychostruthus taczanowskii]
MAAGFGSLTVYVPVPATLLQVIVMSSHETIRVLEVGVDGDPKTAGEGAGGSPAQGGPPGVEDAPASAPSSSGGEAAGKAKAASPTPVPSSPAPSQPGVTHLAVQATPQVLAQESLATGVTGVMVPAGTVTQPLLIPISIAGQVTGQQALALVTIPTATLAALPGLTPAAPAGAIFKPPVANLTGNRRAPQVSQVPPVPQVQPIQPAPAGVGSSPVTKVSPPPVPITCSETPTVSQLVSKPPAPPSAEEDGINLEEIREFAKNFKLRRLSLGLTQTQVGQALTATEGPAYSQSAICRFEKLDITPKSAQKLKPVLEKWLREAEQRQREGQQHLLEFVGGEPGKKRKRRTSFTPQALEALNAHFERNALPTGAEITRIAQELRYEREVVRVWFCNRRQTLKNTSKLNVFHVP